MKKSLQTPPIDGLVIKPVREREKKKEMSLTEVMNMFSEEEAMQIAFIPVILTEMAHSYVMQACTMCAEQRLEEYKKDVRDLKKYVEGYEQGLLDGIHAVSMERIRKQVESFQQEVSSDLTKLYFAINGEIKKCHPERTEYDIPTLLYMAVTINAYQRLFENDTDDMIAEKCGQRLGSITNPVANEVINRCRKMLVPCKIEATRNIEIGMYIIAQKLRKCQFAVVD